MQPFPHPNNDTHKIWSRLADWLRSYSSSNVGNFRHSRASNSKMSGLIRPKIELDPAFMPVLVTSNFDDSIKNERASMETRFSHYKFMGRFYTLKGETLCMSSLPASIKRIGSKATKKKWRHHFPHYKSMGAFCCHGHQFWSNLPQNILQHFPTPSDATHKIWSRLANWLQRYSNLKVWTTTDDDGRRRTTSDHRYTISWPCEPSAQVS